MKKNYVKGKALGLMEGYNSFMYKDSVRRNEGIVARKTTIQDEMERQQQEKEAEKAARKAEKQAQKEQAKAEREQRRLERQQAFEETTEEENRRIFFSKEDGEEIEATMVDINQLVDDKYSKFEKAPKGMDLLKRNLKSSRLYIDDDGDLLKVQSIKEVETEMQDISKVYLLLDTNREYFVVEFNCIRTF